MDADDICLPQRLQHQVDFMQSHPEAVLLGGAHASACFANAMHFFTSSIGLPAPRYSYST